MKSDATNSSQNSNDDELLTIGELSERCKMTQRTIHLYEERGLICSVRRQESGHRYFTQQMEIRLKKIMQLKGIGLNLKEISQVIDLYFSADDYGASGKRAALVILKGHLAEADQKLVKMTKFREDLMRSITRLETLMEESVSKANQ